MLTRNLKFFPGMEKQLKTEVEALLAEK